jgi:hypothetical protein
VLGLTDQPTTNPRRLMLVADEIAGCYYEVSGAPFVRGLPFEVVAVASVLSDEAIERAIRAITPYAGYYDDPPDFGAWEARSRDQMRKALAAALGLGGDVTEGSVG